MSSGKAPGNAEDTESAEASKACLKGSASSARSASSALSGGSLEEIERAIEAAPDAIDGYLAKGRKLRATGGDQGVVLRAFRRATECGGPPLLRAEALREYALALEPIGRHKEAAAALEDALAL
ncbi:MAG TPA: hypothetical protein VHF22_07165, partial [Planctomycetota bacterium]|nr:hypothetical protein [Planctomycetota bacterium]